MQRLRQATNTILQILYGSIVAGFILGQFGFNRRNLFVDFCFNGFIKSGYPISTRVSIQCNGFNNLFAIQELDRLCFSIILHIKLCQTVNLGDIIPKQGNKTVNLFLSVIVCQCVSQTIYNSLCFLCALCSLSCSSLCLTNLLTHGRQELCIPIVIGRVIHCGAGKRFQNIQLFVRLCTPQIILRFAATRYSNCTSRHNFKLQHTLFDGGIVADHPVKPDLISTIAHVDGCGIVLSIISVNIVDLNRHAHQVNTIIITRHLKRNDLTVVFLCDIYLSRTQCDFFIGINRRKIIVREGIKPRIVATSGEILVFHREGCHILITINYWTSIFYGSLQRHCGACSDHTFGFFK